MVRAFVFILGAGMAFGQSLPNPVAELDRNIREGKTELKFDDAQGYLRSLLAALHVPVESQIAVFSRTGVQSLRTNPHNPRTLFFNDSVIVGWVRGGFIEVLVQDPRQGILFYTLDNRTWVHEQRTAQPVLAPRKDCLHCHTAGTIIRSVQKGPGAAAINTDQRTPFDKLWGGWYVTGNSGSARHMGDGLNLPDLKDRFDTDAYLSPYSDIVALMVFEHQTHMMNLLARAMQDKTVVNELVDYMLFVDEAPLPDRIAGSSGFAEKFAARGPLREFDLKHRLMRYPCSYMIYTEAFDELPAATKDAVYRRMWEILPGRENGPAAMEILRKTKKDLPDSLR